MASADTLFEDLQHQIDDLGERLAETEVKLSKAKEILAAYDAALNSLPGHQKVLLGNAIVAAVNRTCPEDLAAMLTEAAQEAKRVVLAQPRVHLCEPPSEGMSEAAWRALVPCRCCGKQIGWDDPYVHYRPADTFLGYICHVGCIPT